jgi:serine beta-lactamase-like protein LACTB
VSKSWNRTETWLALIVVAIGGLLAAIAGLHAYMTATATPLHPEPNRVSSVANAAPAKEWAEAAERGRGISRAGLSEQNLPGVSVAVGVGGDIVWAEGFGWADLEDRVPVSPETRFRIGTASTAVTAAAAGLLLEKGRLKLDDEIQTYVPEFPRKEWPVTLRQLMGHLAGVRNDGGDEGPLLSERCERPVDALQSFAGRPLLFEPGTRDTAGSWSARRSRPPRTSHSTGSWRSRSSSRSAWRTPGPTSRRSGVRGGRRPTSRGTRPTLVTGWT